MTSVRRRKSFLHPWHFEWTVGEVLAAGNLADDNTRINPVMYLGLTVSESKELGHVKEYPADNGEHNQNTRPSFSTILNDKVSLSGTKNKQTGANLLRNTPDPLHNKGGVQDEKLISGPGAKFKHYNDEAQPIAIILRQQSRSTIVDDSSCKSCPGDRPTLRRYRTENTLVAQAAFAETRNCVDPDAWGSSNTLDSCSFVTASDRSHCEDSCENVFITKSSEKGTGKRGQCYNVRERTITSFGESSTNSYGSLKSAREELEREGQGIENERKCTLGSQISESFDLDKYIIPIGQPRTPVSRVSRLKIQSSQAINSARSLQNFDRVCDEYKYRAATYPLEGLYRKRKSRKQRKATFCVLLSCWCAKPKRRRQFPMKSRHMRWAKT